MRLGSAVADLLFPFSIEVSRGIAFVLHGDYVIRTNPKGASVQLDLTSLGWAWLSQSAMV
jgi:hypothetical protein